MVSEKKYEFSPEVEKRFQWLLTRYPTKDAVLLPILHLVQDENKWLTPDSIEYVAKRMDLSPARVREVASFYTMFRLNQKGQYVLQVCHNISCYLRGSDGVIEHIKKRLNIKENEITPDGKFSLERVECLASCGTAPVLQVNGWDYHEELTIEKVDRIIDDLLKDKNAYLDYEKRISEGSVA
jgi:NADH-quinone oxidoreductase subunit E